MYNKIKSVINKIDFNLKEVFEYVKINTLDGEKELTFEIKLSGLKSNPLNKAELVILMTESTIFENSMMWRYKVNPLVENSMCINRTSTLNSITIDVEQIINENRFSKEYLDTLLESINESMEENSDVIWLSVDKSEPVTFDEFYKINTDMGVEQLTPVEFDEIRNMKMGDILTFGMGVDVERVNHSYDNIDESFEFNFEDSVVFEGKEAIIIDRDKLVVESVEYNVYQVYIDGVQESIFEYDLKKK